MRWNPYLNAVAATAYIVGVALFVQFISSLRHDTPDTLLDTAGVLSLLVFSTALMGFLFFYRPAVLLVENKRNEAVSFFLKTLGTFAVLTVLLLVFVSIQ